MDPTAFTDCSQRVLIDLAADTTRRATSTENHRAKVVHFLGKQGWIETVRGKGGGISLALQPEQINVGRVVRDTEGAAMPAECFSEDGGHCIIGSCCRLKGVLAEATRAFHAVLGRCTLADLSRNRQLLGKVLLIQAA
jgi:Rrf2 family transcriptional regulator, nitric oxide-sensitive transcriptional repressor